MSTMHSWQCSTDMEAGSRCAVSQNSLAYATRVRTIKNDVTKIEASKEMMRLKRQVRLPILSSDSENVVHPSLMSYWGLDSGIAEASASW